MPTFSFEDFRPAARRKRWRKRRLVEAGPAKVRGEPQVGLKSAIPEQGHAGPAPRGRR